MSALQEIHDPLKDGTNHENDVPRLIREELMQAAIDKGINYYWLCALYRQGFHDGRGASEGVLTMAVARLGGVVEGAPTGRHNFLQRIDALRAMEAEVSKEQR